ncbi:MAG TPA: hypothetical protein VIK08_09245 [Candidatus Limnocylindrales bacterium]
MGTWSRFVATTLLVLIALGGAGLTVAADRVQTPDQRPEVMWAADQAAQPWIATLTADLTGIATAATALSKAGRDTLGNLQGLAADKVRSAMGDGDSALATISGAIAGLQTDLAQANSHIDRWRLGPETSAQMDAFDAAVDAVGDLGAQWTRIKTRATLVTQLLDELAQHDSQVFRATTAGRQTQWSDALNDLDAAASSLGAAGTVRDELAGAATIDTLDDLLGRDGTYDSALRALYEYIGSGGAQSGDQFDTLQGAVQSAQSALPSDDRALSVIVGEAAGAELSDALAALEHDRGKINDALAATNGGASQ